MIRNIKQISFGGYIKIVKYEGSDFYKIIVNHKEFTIESRHTKNSLQELCDDILELLKE